MAHASPCWLLALGAVCSVERKEDRFNTSCSAWLRSCGLLGRGRCRWKGRCRYVLTAQFALHPTRIVSPSLHGAHCMRPQVEAQRLSLQDCCRRAPLAKAHPWVLLCSCGSPGCRPPHPPHRPDCGLPPPLDSPPPAAPPACSCAIHMPLSRLSALLGRFPPIPLTCAQVRNGTIYLKLT